MIRRASKQHDISKINEILHPVVKEWFYSKFKEFTPPQRFSIVNIHNRINTLISSPTGSGKTLSAFLAIINDLVIKAFNNSLEDRVYAIYISPLKALGNDIERNLMKPLSELQEITKSKHNKELPIRVGVRTGDTTSYQKSLMLKKPPHILITTPESFAIMLSSSKFRELLRNAPWVIVDEIHALAENKRGVHLSLSMERFEELSNNFCRIALSATVSPLEEVAKFLAGFNNDGSLRDCEIVDVNYLKKLDLKVLSPVRNLIREDYDVIAKSTYKIIHELVQKHRTTLIFTNTRSATERVVHNLKTLFPKYYSAIIDNNDIKFLEESNEEKRSNNEKSNNGNNDFSRILGRSLIAAHHGSLSKDHRLWVEEQLKKGSLKVVVSSTSLELGIDIGNIDLVILLGSPKSVARALQRTGRSGHQLHEKSIGRIIVQDRDDLVESAVLIKAAVEGRIDHIRIPKYALDVLAQHIVGIAVDNKISINDLYNIINRSYSFHDLERSDFNSLIDYLAGLHTPLEQRHVYAKIWKDEETGMIGRRGRLARTIYLTNIGTIPDETNIKVKYGDSIIGSISEPFLERLRKGDVFVLGGETYEFRYSQGLTAFVRAAPGRKPTVPSWFSEMLPLSFDLALEIQKFRRYINDYLTAGKTREEIVSFINDYLLVDEMAAQSIYEYFAEQHRFLEIPHDKKLLIEHYNDGRDKYVFFHSLYGRRVNDVLSRCVAYAIGKTQHRDVEVIINDNGFAIRSRQGVQAGRAFRIIRSDEIRIIAEKAIELSEVLARRFRHCAARSFMILRNYKGKSKSVGKQQLSSRLLLRTVKELDDNFVILKEARREVLEDLMDINNAVEVIKKIESGEIIVKEVQTSVPSPFAFNLFITGYSDILKMSDRQEFLRNMHDLVLAKISLKHNNNDGLLSQASQNPGISKSFSYDSFWNDEEKTKTIDESEKTSRMMNDLIRAIKKEKVNPIVAQDLKALVLNTSNYKFRPETLSFLKELLGGTIKKVWTDELVYLFREKLKNIEWSLKE